MDEAKAERVVGKLRQRGVLAHVDRSGVFQFGIRVVIPDGREAVWDSDGASGLEATVMRNGVLVGFVPTIPDSESFDEDAVVAAVAAASYCDD